MDKSKYLELARRKGWDKEIPRLKNGTYACHLFGGDNVKFDFDVNISGNISLGNNAHLLNISTRYGSIYIGEYAFIKKITAGRDITIGCCLLIPGDITAKGGNITIDDGSFIYGNITTDKGNITLGDSTFAGDIKANGNVIIGDFEEIGGDIRASGNVTIGDKKKISGKIFAGGNVTIGDLTTIGIIFTNGKLVIGLYCCIERIDFLSNFLT